MARCHHRYVLDFLRDDRIYDVPSGDRLALLAEAYFQGVKAKGGKALARERDLLAALKGGRTSARRRQGNRE